MGADATAERGEDGSVMSRSGAHEALEADDEYAAECARLRRLAEIGEAISPHERRWRDLRPSNVTMLLPWIELPPVDPIAAEAEDEAFALEFSVMEASPNDPQ